MEHIFIFILFCTIFKYISDSIFARIVTIDNITDVIVNMFSSNLNKNYKIYCFEETTVEID